MTLEGVHAVAITVSDRTSRGERADASGPELVAALRAAGCRVAEARVIPDGAEPVVTALRDALAAGARLVVTTGGTGIGPRDRTPEGTQPLLTLVLPGIATALRANNAPGAMLSRGVAGIAAGSAGDALIVNLPGSVSGAREGIALVLRVAGHALAQLDGHDHPTPHAHGHRAESSGHEHDHTHTHERRKWDTTSPEHRNAPAPDPDPGPAPGTAP